MLNYVSLLSPHLQNCTSWAEKMYLIYIQAQQTVSIKADKYFKLYNCI